MEHILMEFENSVKGLLEEPTLERALEVNLASLRMKELLYEKESKHGGVPEQIVRSYSMLIHLSLRKFQEMIPHLNGQARHVDLYSEQMRGRKAWIANIKQY